MLKEKGENNMKNRLKFYFVTAMLIAFAFGCTQNNNESSTDANSDEKVIRVALANDPGFDQLDNILTGSQLIQANAMVYEGLVKYGKKGSLEPSLAESWEISEDGKEYIFKLRKNVLFTDGTPLNAEAVKFSFERWVYDPKMQSISIAQYLDSIKIIDDMTIAFTFKQSYYPILTEFSYPRPVRIMSLNSVSPAGDPKGTFVKAIGTGAWMIDSYKKDQEAILSANPNYWNGKAKINKIIFSVIPDPQARIYAIQNGEVDIVGGALSSVSIDSLASVKESENIEVKQYPSTMSYFSIFNYNKAALKDIHVRKAMNMLLDKDAFVKHLMNGIGKPAKALFQADVPFTSDENSEWYSFNIDEAKKILTQAGYTINKDGIQEKNGQQLIFNLVFSDQEFTEWRIIAEYMQAQFLKAGIKLNLENRELNAYYDSLWKDKDYDLIIYRTYADSWNPHGFLLSLFNGSKESPAIAWNDDDLSAMIQSVITQTTDANKQKGYDAIYKKMYSDACFIPLYYPNEIFLVSKRLKNVKVGFDSYIPFLWNEIDID